MKQTKQLQIVSCNQAKRLKSLEFDWFCFERYIDENERVSRFFWSNKFGNVTNRKNWFFLSPKTMVYKEEKHCVYCSSTDLVKNGKCPGGSQRWRCNSCKKGFRFDYRYNARKQGVREKIIEMTLNGSGVRDVGRVLKTSRDTVCPVLKKNAKNEPLFSHKRGNG